MHRVIDHHPHPRVPSDIDIQLADAVHRIIPELLEAARVALSGRGHPGHREALRALRSIVSALNDLNDLEAFVRYSQANIESEHAR